MTQEPVLELIDATVVKDGVRVLDGLTWTIEDGQHTAIVDLGQVPDRKHRQKI